MSQTDEMIDSLKRVLKSRGLTYKQLADALFLSEASVKRLFAQNRLSLGRLETICGVLNISISDLVRMTPTHAGTAVSRLTLEQEATLASSSRLLTFFGLLNNEWSPARIEAEYGIGGRAAAGYRAQLSTAGLIIEERHGRVRTLTARRIDWRPDGPVMRLYEAQAKAEFLKSAFDGPNEAFKAMTGELLDASIALLKRKLQQLTREFDEMVDVDRPLPGRAKHSVGLLTAIRPWTFSVVSQHRVAPVPATRATSDAGKT